MSKRLSETGSDLYAESFPYNALRTNIWQKPENVLCFHRDGKGLRSSGDEMLSIMSRVGLGNKLISLYEDQGVELG